MRRFLLIVCVLALLAGFAAPTFAQSGQTIHIVDRGETLSGIARQYGISVQSLAAANGIFNPNVLWAGMRLVIPSGVYSPPPAPPPSQQSYYIVLWGDTLAKIANHFGTSVWAIAQANNLLNLNQIYAGMYLVIPGGSAGYPPPPQTQTVQYWIKPGDTLATIAWQFGTSVQTIASFNGIGNPNQIFWGMQLTIPVTN